MDKEQEIQDPHPDFVKGFNEGYLLAKYAPEVGGLFGAYAPQTERGKGFCAGKSQYAMPLEKKRYPDLLRDAKDNSRDIKDGYERNQESLKKDADTNRQDIGVGKIDHRLSLLEDKDQNKDDMNLDREQPDKADHEPDLA